MYPFPMKNIPNTFIVFLCFFYGCAGQSRFDNSILWSVEHPVTGARSYVMGTIHHIDTNYLTLPLDQIAALIAETDFLCVEVKLSAARQQPAEYAKAMFVSDTTQRVMGALDETYRKKLSSILQATGQARDRRFEVMLPYMKPQTISFLLLTWDQQNSPLFKEPNFSPEAYFERYAKANGISVMGFEKSEDQLNYMLRDEGASFEEGLEQLEASIDYFAGDSTERIDIYANYQRQDLSLLPPEVYEDSIMVMRNGNMARQADSLMQNKKIFLMVGAAHLPFSTGILHSLQEKGYRVRPVETAIALKQSR